MTETPSSSSAASPATLRRRGAMTAWGVVLIIAGALGVLSCAGVLLSEMSSIESSLVHTSDTPRYGRAVTRVPAMSSQTLMATGVSLLCSAGVVWTGIGACMGRRWVRPVIMVFAGFVIAFGLLHIVRAALELPHLIDLSQSAAQRPTYGAPSTAVLPSSVILLTCIHIGMVLAVAVVLPWFLYRFFASADTAAALDSSDPSLTWTDRCPVAVLGWSAFCLAGAAGALLQLNHPAVPAFTVAITGMPAIVTLCVFGILLLWGAWLCYRMDRLGWVMTSLLVLAVDVSLAAFFYNGGKPSELYPADALGTPAARSSRAVASDTFSTPWLSTTMATLEAAVALGFGTYVARYFLNTHWRVTALPAARTVKPIASDR